MLKLQVVAVLLLLEIIENKDYNPSILSGYVYDLSGIGEQSGGSGGAGGNGGGNRSSPSSGTENTGGGGGGGSIAGSSYNFTCASGGSGIVIICNTRS